jgi:hypothetical protein
MILGRFASRLFPSVRRTRRIALVSCLPPERSGIADFTHQLLAASGEIFQAYAEPSARRAYLGSHSHDDAPQSVLPISRFELDMRKNVDAVVLMVGNSPHFASVLEWASALQRRSPTPPLVLYAHDAFLQSVLLLLSARDQLMAQMERDHGRAMRVPGSAGELAELVSRRVLGIAAIVKWLRPRMVIVNSGTSKALVESEPGWPRDVPVETAFHPVFPAAVRWIRRTGHAPLRIGAFGVPNLFKRLDVLVAAHSRLRTDHPDARLVLAGYGVGGYAVERGISGLPGLEVCDSPGEKQLGDLMASVDVAVQLRNADLGESSGMIWRLLGIGTPVIASPLGASLELGDAVAFTSTAPDAQELAELILREVASAGQRDERVREYTQRHTYQQLGSRIAQLALGGRSSDVGPGMPG